MRIAAPPRLLLASASPARLRTLQAAGIEADVVVSGVDESLVGADRPDALCATLARMKAGAVAERLRQGRGPSGVPGADPSPSAPANATGSGGSPAPESGKILVLGCDSVLSFDGEIFGKPVDPADAVRRWRRMRGREGVLFTGHCLVEVNAAGPASRNNASSPGGGGAEGLDPGTANNPGAGSGTAGGQPPAHAADRLAEAVAATTVRFADVSDAEISAYVATGEPMYVAGAFTIDGIGGPFVESVDGDPGTVIGLSLPLLRRLLAELGVRVFDLWRPEVRGTHG